MGRFALLARYVYPEVDRLIVTDIVNKTSHLMPHCSLVIQFNSIPWIIE